MIKEEEDSYLIKGVIKFSKISVRNLKKLNTTEKIDPYVVFQINESTQ